MVSCRKNCNFCHYSKFNNLLFHMLSITYFMVNYSIYVINYAYCN